MTAIDQPGAILRVDVADHAAKGRGPTMLGGDELSGVAMCVPGPCAAQPPATTHTGISADPAADTLTYGAQERMSADGSREHTVYSNGDETSTELGADDFRRSTPPTIPSQR